MPAPVLSPILGFTEVDPNVLMPTTQANQAMLDLEQGTLGEIDIAMANADQTPTAAQLKHWTFKCTGALSATRKLIVPATKRPYDVLNATTGGQNIRVIGASGTGVDLSPGTEQLVRFDGTNVVAITNGATGSSPRFPVRVLTSGASTQLVAGSDYTLFVKKGTGSATTVYLSDPPADQDRFEVKDLKGDADTNNITVTAPADVSPTIATIDGQATYVINQPFGAAVFVYSGTAQEWGVL